jgi:hypothetical protein
MFSLYPNGLPSGAGLSAAPLDDAMTGYLKCSDCSQRDGCKGTAFCLWSKEGAD